MKKSLILLFYAILVGCSSATEYKPKKPYGYKRFEVIYNAHMNTVIGNQMFVRNLGDVSMFLHEYGHVLHFHHLKPNDKLVELLSKEYPIPPKIIPSDENRELQDFITTSTRWKVEYPFKHNKDCLVVEELMANLFVIFTLGGENLLYVRENYNDIYLEYKKYYNSL